MIVEMNQEIFLIQIIINRRWKMKEWLREHVELFSIAALIFSGFLWMNGKFNDIDRRFADADKQFIEGISEVKQEIAVMKTVLIIKNIMPSELAKAKE